MGEIPVEHIWSLLTVIGTMMLVIGLGFLVARFGIINEHGRKEITELIIYLVFPCYVISGFIKNIGMLGGGDTFFALGLAVLVQGATLAANHFLYRKVSIERRSVLRYATAISNSAFLGLPLVESVFGSPGLIYASIFVIPQRVNCFGIAVNYFTPAENANALKKALTQPSILATVAGIAIMLTGWQPPQLVVNTVSSIAACSTPLSMLMIGVMIYSFVGEQRLDKLTVHFTILRLIVIPLAIFIPFRLAGMSRIVVGTAVLLGAMPAGTTVALLADKYGMDTGFAGKLVLVTTVASLLTIPVWSYLCLYV